MGDPLRSPLILVRPLSSWSICRTTLVPQVACSTEPVSIYRPSGEPSVRPPRCWLRPAHAGIKVVYLKMAFRPDLSDVGPPGAPNRERHLQVFHVGERVLAPDGSESRILIRDTWNTDIVPELEPQPSDIVMYKHRFSGFYETELDAVLKSLGI